jgi:UDP-galactopyranose mutase
MKVREEPVVCFSPLRWNDAYQRPHHLMRRAGRDREVYFVEEPIYDDVMPAITTWYAAPGVTVVVPHLPVDLTPAQADSAQRRMIDDLVAELSERPVLWYYTPMALRFTAQLAAAAVVYDCLEEPPLVDGEPPELGAREAELVSLADVVFTDSDTLKHHKLAATRHPHMYPFPSRLGSFEVSWDQTWTSMWAMVERAARARRRRALAERRVLSQPAIHLAAFVD